MVLSSPSQLALLPGVGGRDLSIVMETLIDQAESVVRVAQCGFRGVQVGEAFHPGPSSLNRFWALGEPADDVDRILLDALEEDLAGDAPTNVRRLRLTLSQGPVLPSRDEFVATTVVDSGAESDIVSSSGSGFREEPGHGHLKCDCFASFDEVDLEGIFLVRACVMKSVPAFLKGACCSVMRVALREADRERDSRDLVGQTRVWKLFLLLPRLLLHRPPRGGLVPTRRVVAAVVIVVMTRNEGRTGRVGTSSCLGL